MQDRLRALRKEIMRQKSIGSELASNSLTRESFNAVFEECVCVYIDSSIIPSEDEHQVRLVSFPPGCLHLTTVHRMSSLAPQMLDDNTPAGISFSLSTRFWAIFTAFASYGCQTLSPTGRRICFSRDA